MKTPDEETGQPPEQGPETEPDRVMDDFSETVDGTVDARSANAAAQQSFGSPPPGAEYAYGI
ncbi:hypothetical protein [Stieleria mannarensis]|uniref:hypothetical protein n=1 Tax=Stieleria mannarensis TaxID=2755585 RepID=UPI0016021FAE|nr:hypothetical protein [Rhodopirellula sp. JC639]